MFVLLRLILIAWLALPQGWCCAAKGCEKPSSSIATGLSKTNKCCSCCREKAVDAAQNSARPDSEKCPPSNSCECKCRFQIAIPKSFASLDVVYTISSDLFEQVETLTPNLGLDGTAIEWRPPVRLQILYCVWLC